MSNEYVLEQVPSKLRIADVTRDISMTYTSCLDVFAFSVKSWNAKLTIGCNSLLIFGNCKNNIPVYMLLVQKLYCSRCEYLQHANLCYP